MIRIITILLLIVNVTISFCQSIEEELDRAMKSTKRFTGFVEDWHTGSKPYTDIEFNQLTAIEKDVCLIYSDLMCSDSLWSILQKFNTGINHDLLIVQSSLRYYFTSQALSGVKDSIANLIGFRPNVNLADKKILYFSRDYQIATYDFLCSDIPNQGLKVKQRAEIQRRKDYLKKEFSICIEGGKVISRPHIETINFSDNNQKAIVIFNIAYRGAAHYVKIDNLWKLVEIGVAWRE